MRSRRHIIEWSKIQRSAGLPLLDFGTISGKKKETYFAAVQAGLDKNYKPMEKLFEEIIERSVAAS